MTKKGVTILELLVSISLTSIIVLFLFKVMFSLNKVNNDETYASSDEIGRTELIKNIENDFLSLKLKGLDIKENNDLKVIFYFDNGSKELIVKEDKIIYDNNDYILKSKNASYSLCPDYSFEDLDNNYYLMNLKIAVLINNDNTTINDDLDLTYLGLKNDTSNYLESFSCIKK